MTVEVILVRHGRTDWNDEGRYQGQDGPGLNALGRWQAWNAAQAIVKMPQINALYTSDLTRAVETAQIIATILKIPFQADPRLREIHQGRWQGMLFEEIKSHYSDALKQFQADPIAHSPPGGETLVDLMRRFTAALNDFAHAHAAGRIVVVTHKLPMAALKCMLVNRPPTQIWEAIPENAQAQTIQWSADTSILDEWLKGSAH